MNAANAYMDAVDTILKGIRDTQLQSIGEAARIFTETIAGDGLVHMFASGHSRVFLEEMFPRLDHGVDHRVALDAQREDL
ncbi:MAG: SIS domain-containing protein, partial [Anaerolineae bacterium]|nr:SIS domain-containing protein [Anaerolineae bacterium]